jgi:hypothetical protein
MGEYGLAAIRAVNIFINGTTDNLIEAWDIATIEFFGKGTYSQTKGCPKETFLGLCNEGLVKGIPSAHYTNSIKNKKYAVDAVKILKNNPLISANKLKLWHMVAGNKSYDQQMDVVISLWNEGLVL